MRGLYFTLSFFCFLVAMTGCHAPPPKQYHSGYFTQNVMTINYHITVGDALSLHQAEQVQQIITTTFKEIDDIYNKWNPSSEISVLNTLPAHTPILLSPQLNHFLLRVDHFVKLSEGRFDPTIEPIQQLWKAKLENGQCPTSQDIEALRSCIGWRTLHIKNGFFSKDDARTQLDLGGIAKGYCVDLLMERLHGIGLNHLFIEWGGEIRTLGFHPSKRPWRVFISRLANSDPANAIAEVDLINCALATSGDYFQHWKVTHEDGEEKIYCHVFNPLTMTPLEIRPGSVASASLLASDCMQADALAKVLMLFDSAEDAQAWVEKLQMQSPNLACWIVTRS